MSMSFIHSPDKQSGYGFLTEIIQQSRKILYRAAAPQTLEEK